MMEKLGGTSGGWETLYRDRRDGRFWELFYPYSEVQYSAGLIPEWDAATQSRNRQKMIGIQMRRGNG